MWSASILVQGSPAQVRTGCPDSGSPTLGNRRRSLGMVRCPTRGSGQGSHGAVRLPALGIGHRSQGAVRLPTLGNGHRSHGAVRLPTLSNEHRSLGAVWLQVARTLGDLGPMRAIGVRTPVGPEGGGCTGERCRSEMLLSTNHCIPPTESGGISNASPPQKRPGTRSTSAASRNCPRRVCGAH